MPSLGVHVGKKFSHRTRVVTVGNSAMAAYEVILRGNHMN